MPDLPQRDEDLIYLALFRQNLSAKERLYYDYWLQHMADNPKILSTEAKRVEYAVYLLPEET